MVVEPDEAGDITHGLRRAVLESLGAHYVDLLRRKNLVPVMVFVFEGER